MNEIFSHVRRPEIFLGSSSSLNPNMIVCWSMGSEQALIQTSTGPVRRGRFLVVGSRGEKMGVVGKVALLGR